MTLPALLVFASLAAAPGVSPTDGEGPPGAWSSGTPRAARLLPEAVAWAQVEGPEARGLELQSEAVPDPFAGKVRLREVLAASSSVVVVDLLLATGLGLSGTMSGPGSAGAYVWMGAIGLVVIPLVSLVAAPLAAGLAAHLAAGNDGLYAGSFRRAVLSSAVVHFVTLAGLGAAYWFGIVQSQSGLGPVGTASVIGLLAARWSLMGVAASRGLHQPASPPPPDPRRRPWEISASPTDFARREVRSAFALPVLAGTL